MNVFGIWQVAMLSCPPQRGHLHCLDYDVKTETVAGWTAAANYAMLAEFQAHAGRIQYLPWTPEVGLVSYLRQPGGVAEQALRHHFGNPLITVLRPISASSAEPRWRTKTSM